VPVATTIAPELREELESVPGWYHTLELPGDFVTRGFYDHRKVLPKLPIPNSLEGKRCLDLASADGLFAFEMARRGGDVVSVDLDDKTQEDWQGTGGKDAPTMDGTRRNFELARRALGLEVERVNLNLYDVSPEELGTFDFVFMGNILLHLSDPGRALSAARSVTTGQFLSFEVVSLPLTLLRPRTAVGQLCQVDDARWWTPNLAGHRRLLQAAGFEIEDTGFPLFQRFGALVEGLRFKAPWKVDEPLGQHLGYWLFNRPIGVPSAYALCVPGRTPVT
jgi:tRNA (mo5U34)-methyltransferase